MAVLCRPGQLLACLSLPSKFSQIINQSQERLQCSQRKPFHSLCSSHLLELSVTNILTPKDVKVDPPAGLSCLFTVGKHLTTSCLALAPRLCY